MAKKIKVLPKKFEGVYGCYNLFWLLLIFLRPPLSFLTFKPKFLFAAPKLPLTLIILSKASSSYLGLLREKIYACGAITYEKKFREKISPKKVKKIFQSHPSKRKLVSTSKHCFTSMRNRYLMLKVLLLKLKILHFLRLLPQY